MMHRTDLHILHDAKSNREWLSEAIASVRAPVNLYIFDNKENKINKGRYEAIKLGHAEFVTWLDCDDILLSGAIEKCIEALDANPTGIGAFTDNFHVDERLNIIKKGVSSGTGEWRLRKMPYLGGYCENISVFRRSAVEKYLPDLEKYDNDACDHWFRGILGCEGTLIHIEEPGVLYRRHADNASLKEKRTDTLKAYSDLYERIASTHADHDIDVHVLYCHEPKDWIDICLKSLEKEPVNVHFCAGIAGQVGEARARAFECGNAEYVSFVDGDDAVEPGCFAAALEILDAHPEVVSTYCDVTVIDTDGRENGGYYKGPWNPWTQLWTLAEVHHCHVMRRAAVMPYLEELAKWESLEEWVLMGLLARHGMHWHIPKALYRFRQHGAYQRAGALITPKLRQRGFDLCAPALIDAHRRGVRQESHGA